jgi:ABC-type methionine transport system permease subunit
MFLTILQSEASSDSISVRFTLNRAYSKHQSIPNILLVMIMIMITRFSVVSSSQLQQSY